MKNQEIIREIWFEEVSVSKMRDLKDKFAQGLGIAYTSVDKRINGSYPTNDFEFIMMVEILSRVVNVEKWQKEINEVKRRYGMYEFAELR
ncbi:MAG: hypothetical protein MJZ30_09915 [Paludibacteraceae bacterium]|nr:hypothetical protein [Paludibacteraceae bacterium]